MENSKRIYTHLRNEYLKSDISKVIRLFKADKMFNYIDANIINLFTSEHKLR